MHLGPSIHAIGSRKPGGTCCALPDEDSGGSWQSALNGASGDSPGIWKPQIETRLLEQGPAVSALLKADWVVCLPSLDLPG